MPPVGSCAVEAWQQKKQQKKARLKAVAAPGEGMMG